jgi:hypothetical protein
MKITCFSLLVLTPYLADCCVMQPWIYSVGWFTVLFILRRAVAPPLPFRPPSSAVMPLPQPQPAPLQKAVDCYIWGAIACRSSAIKWFAPSCHCKPVETLKKPAWHLELFLMQYTGVMMVKFAAIEATSENILKCWGPNLGSFSLRLQCKMAGYITKNAKMQG